jgi:hypothetical protein
MVEASLNLAWSHWSALGVRGITRPPSSAVDPEALLYFTACLAEHDPRLRDEVADWWNQYKRYISRPRMNALSKRFGEAITAKLNQLEHGFPTTPRTRKSRLDHLNSPARSLLRLRCAFGANARAEVLLELLTRRGQPEDGLTALALSEVGYSKRNIAFVLEELVMAGILVSASEGNRVRYRLTDPVGLERVLRPIPSTPGRWHLRLPILAAFIELAVRLRDRDAIVQSIEARKTLQTLMPMILGAGIIAPGPSASADTYWPELQRWLIENVIADDSDSAHRLPRMIEGMWVAPNEIPSRTERGSSAVLPRVTANPNDDRELVCLDLVQAPTVAPATDWVWAVLSTAATTTYTHTIGLNNRERWRFVSWQFGDERTYSVEYADPLPHDRISRLYGKTAASRARADHPAVQLRLTRLEPDVG